MPWGKIPAGEKSLRGNIPTEISPQGRYQNVIIYLKHTQLRQTDCKSEPKLDLRPFNRCFKKSLRGKIPAGKNPRRG